MENKSESGNIMERAKINKAMLENAGTWKALYSTYPVGVSILDEEGNILDFNAALETILSLDEEGLRKGAYRHRRYLFSDGTEMRAEDLPSARAVKEQRVVHDVEIGVVKEDGELIWTKVSAAPLNLPGISCVVATADITKYKSIERALLASEKDYQLLFDASPDGIVLIGLDGYIARANITQARMYQYASADDLIGVHATQLVAQSSREHSAQIMHRRLRGEDIPPVEYELVRKDGSTFYGETSATILRTNAGTVSGYLCVTRDTTKRKRTQEELGKVQRLDSLGVLAGGIAHDFNNLVGGILGYIDLAREESTNDTVTSYLSKAMNTIDRARELTQQLLTFAKGGAPILKTEQLFPVIQETAEFAPSGSNVTCRYDVPGDLWACNFDKHQIGQVIGNIIMNAQQAMPVGGTVELSGRNILFAEKEHPTLTKGNYVRISIRDFGIGIQKEFMTKIFDPFFTTKAQGHGLGLATCYSIVKRHGGCIDVESELSKGSVFHVYLPAALESASPNGKKTPRGHKGSGTFLIMDDEVVMRETMHDMLVSFGYTAVCKENGNDAVDFFAAETKQNRRITAAIFDLTVPGGMGGKAAVEEIRKSHPETPVFVASGYAEDPVMKNPTAYGFTASICKPFTRSELSEMLNRHLKVGK